MPAEEIKRALLEERSRRNAADVVDVRRDEAVEAIDRVLVFVDARPDSDGVLALGNLEEDGRLTISTEAGRLALARVWWYVGNPEYGESGFLKELAAFERYDRTQGELHAS